MILLIYGADIAVSALVLKAFAILRILIYSPVGERASLLHTSLVLLSACASELSDQDGIATVGAGSPRIGNVLIVQYTSHHEGIAVITYRVESVCH